MSLPAPTPDKPLTPEDLKPAEERPHHPYSPSSLELREACPCFENRKVVNVAAVRGTVQHSAVEAGEDLNDMDDDEAVHAAMCADFADRQLALLNEERARDMKANPADIFPPVLDLREIYLRVDDEHFSETIRDPRSGETTVRNFHGTTAGYVDRVLIASNQRRAIMLDWKFGKWAVTDAEKNLQGIAYLLGLFREYELLEEITVYFLQPALNRITFHTFKRSEIPALYLRVQTTVARAMEARQRTDKDDWTMSQPAIPVCNFCGNLGRCEKVARFACHVGHKFHPIEIPADLDPTGLKSPKDSTMGMRLATVLKIWSDSFRKALSDRVIRGAQPMPPGYTLQARTDRVMVDPKLFKSVALRYITQEELEAVSEVPFGAVEKMVSDKAPRGAKKQTIDTFRQELKTAGAVKDGDPYTFLRAANKKAEGE